MGKPQSKTITFTDSTTTINDYYELVVVALGGDPSLSNPSLTSNSYFNVIQQPLPDLGPCTSFWQLNGASPTNKIKAIAGANSLANFYGQKQKDITYSGFNPITKDFTVQVGDEIRFEGTETQTYYINDVSTTNGDIILTLDRTVITTTNLSWFLLRRYITDPSYLILEVDKPAGGTSTGVLTPEYFYGETEEKVDSILQLLTRDNLI